MGTDGAEERRRWPKRWGRVQPGEALVGKGRISGARKSVRGARSVMQREASQHAS